MFKDKSLFVLLVSGNSDEVARIELTKGTQKNVCELFDIAYNDLTQNKTAIAFTGTYNPEATEILAIKDFNIDGIILDAINNPIGIREFIPDLTNLPEIKALFVGKKISKKGKSDKYIIAFQRFRKDQYINRKGVNLFHNQNTFEMDKRYGLTINKMVDCAFDEKGLTFCSYYFARQIFDLSEYYRIATDSDVETFINNPKIQIENRAIFMLHADSWVRRKIALIDDSGIFEKFTVKDIKAKAKIIGMSLSIIKNKINIPSDKKELKNVLKFLDEEIYKGTFSDELYQTNSKRIAEI